MKQEFEAIRAKALEAIGGAEKAEDLEALRVQYLGKKGELTVEQGKALNAELKHKVEEAKEAPEAKDAAPAETEDKAE